MKGARTAAATTCAAVLAANAWHIAANRTAPAFDDAWYLEVSFRIHQALKHDLWSAAQAYVDAFRIKAPLISVLPLPLYALFGTGERVALWVNELAFALTMYFVFRIGRRLYGEKAGLAASMAASLMPLLYGLSRVYLVETVLTCLVTASVWAIIDAPDREPYRTIIRGTFLGLGLLTKSLFPLYLLGPAWLRRRELIRNAGRTLAIGLALAATWYAFNLPYVVGFGWSAGFGRIASDYHGAAGWLSGPIIFLGNFGRDALSWPYAVCAALLAASAWLACGRGFVWTRAESLLAAWFLVPALVLVLGVNKDVRFIAPALPALAVALGAAAASLTATPRRTALLSLLLLPPAAVFAAQTFGIPNRAALAHNGAPARAEAFDREAAVSAVARNARPDSVIAVGVEHPGFNANNLSCLAAAQGHAFRFISLGYAQTSVEAALIRLKDKNADMLLMVRGIPPEELPVFLNRANSGLQARIDSGSLPARRLGFVSLRAGVTAELYGLRR
ncbi:MAG: glycosyltransferase family 39 protein [Elusimicrobia bacterium]|nr:glycosyltransferase family 39 protein [Elusimicrobiota bacterium]